MRCLLNAYNCDRNVVSMFACFRHDQLLIMHINSCTWYTKRPSLANSSSVPSADNGEGDFSGD